LTTTAISIKLNKAPDITEGYMVIESTTSNKEIIKYTGVSGTTLTGCIRGLATFGSDSSSGAGLEHAAGVDIANKDTHFYYSQYYDRIKGTSATGFNTFNIGKGGAVSSDGNTFFQIKTSSVSAFFGLSADGNMVVSPDGVTVYNLSS